MPTNAKMEQWEAIEDDVSGDYFTLIDPFSSR